MELSKVPTAGATFFEFALYSSYNADDNNILVLLNSLETRMKINRKFQ